MADVFTPEKRSKVMSKIGGKDTKPELKIRKALHALGYRYSLHKNNLPGTPDIYLRKYNALIEINGCYWHGHDCHYFNWPKTNENFWKNKILNTKKRDQRNFAQLNDLGYRILIIWQCAIDGKTSLKPQELIQLVLEWLHSENTFKEISGNNHKNA